MELLADAVRPEAVSSVYASDPVGLARQPEFLNAVVVGRTWLPPRELLRLALGVEESLGRRRGVPGGPRTLDVDVVFYGDLVLGEPDLVLPHPRWAERAFVLAPLAEAAPGLVAPGERRTVAESWAERRESLPPVRRVAGPESLWRRHT